MAEFWEKSKSLECFSTEDKGSEYHENHIYTRCNGGLRSVKKQSYQIMGAKHVLCNFVVILYYDLLY